MHKHQLENKIGHAFYANHQTLYSYSITFTICFIILTTEVRTEPKQKNFCNLADNFYICSKKNLNALKSEDDFPRDTEVGVEMSGINFRYTCTPLAVISTAFI
jgi:hypothetical protein